MGKQSNLLKTLTERTRTEDLTVLPLEERCELIRDFSKALIAAGTDPARTRLDNDDDKYLDEAKFENEVRALKQLAGTLRYSETFFAWVRYSENLMVEKFQKKKPASKLCRDWRGANEQKRRGMVMQIMNDQCQAFGEALPFHIPGPQLKWLVGGKPRIIGQVSFDYELLKNCGYPAVELRQSLFEQDTPDQAITTGQHETLHYTLFALAMHAARYDISPGDAFYRDAEMETKKIKHGAVISCAIDSAYRAQPEEKLCYGLEDKMRAEWLQP